jgi:predicted RNA-binding Zn-ribbon protein involved in translation (DUF1610 family)
MRCTILIQAMEMQTCRLVSERVVHVDDDAIAFRCSHCGDWPLAIDANNWPVRQAIRVCMDP